MKSFKKPSKLRYVVFALFFLLIQACGEGLETTPTADEEPSEGESLPTSFVLIPRLEDLDFDAIQPAEDTDYWELRRMGVMNEVIGSSGIKPDTAIVDSFDDLDVTSGFNVQCLPGYCAHYIASIAADTIGIWNTIEELEDFLGEIDTPEDAVLLAFGHDYGWGRDIETAAVREIPEGYELRLLKMVSDCAPIQTDLFVVQISRNGELTVISEEDWSTSEGCI